MTDGARRTWLLSLILIILITLAYRTDQRKRRGGRHRGGGKNCQGKGGALAAGSETSGNSGGTTVATGTEQGTQQGAITGELKVIEYPDEDADIYIGQEAILRLTVNIGQGETHSETRITLEISPQDDAMQILGLSSVYETSAGRGVVVSREDWWRLYTSRVYHGDHRSGTRLVTYGTRAHFNLDNVTNNDLTTDSNITIEYGVMNFGGYGTVAVGTDIETAILIESAETVSNPLKLAKTFRHKGRKPGDDEKPTFSSDNIKEIEVLNPVTFQLKMVLPNTLSQVMLTVDASKNVMDYVTDDVSNRTANNDHSQDNRDVSMDGSYAGVMVQSIVLTRAGKAYRSHINKQLVKKLGYETCPLAAKLTLELGPIVYTDSSRIAESELEDYDALFFDVTLLLTDPLINRSEVFVYIGVNVNGVKVWTSLMTMAVMEQSYTQEPTFRVWHADIPQTSSVTEVNVSSGYKTSILVQLNTPHFSNRTYRLELNTSALDERNTNALRVLEVRPTNNATNLRCQTFPSLVSHIVKNVWSYVYEFQAIDIGLETDETHSTTSASSVFFNVTLVMLGNATVGETYRLASRLGDTPGPTFKYTVDAPPKARFELHARYIQVEAMYPGFVLLKIHTPPGTERVYRGNITVDPRVNGIIARPMSILTGSVDSAVIPRDFYVTNATPGRRISIRFEIGKCLNPIFSGANIENSIEPADLKLKLISLRKDGLIDNATFSFVVKNSGVSAHSDADDVELEIVVKMATLLYQGYGVALRVDIEKLGAKTVVMEPKMFIIYDSPAPVVYVLDPCDDNVWNDGDVSGQFGINFRTQVDTTTGPIEIRIKGRPFIAIRNASIAWKGLNVPCVNIGPVDVVTEHGNNETDSLIVVPLVCNRQITAAGYAYHHDDFSVVVEFELSENEDNSSSSTSEYDVPIEITTHDGPFDRVYSFATKPKIDLEHLHVIKKGELLDSELKKYMYDGDLILEWSIDGIHSVDATTSVQIDADGSQYLQPNYPLIARYIRVLHPHNQCFIQLELTKNRDIPHVHGTNATDTAPLLERILYAALRQFKYSSKCTPLPLPGDQGTPPYLWMDFKTALFNVDASGGPFMVKLEGHGIQCSHKSGPQKTMVVFPKAKLNMFGEKQNQLCDLQDSGVTEEKQVVFPKAKLNMYGEKQNQLCDLQDSGVTVEKHVRCEYKCSCTEEVECRQFTLLIMSTGSSTNRGASTNNRGTSTNNRGMSTNRGNAGRSSTGSQNEDGQDQYSLCYIEAWRPDVESQLFAAG